MKLQTKTFPNVNNKYCDDPIWNKDQICVCEFEIHNRCFYRNNGYLHRIKTFFFWELIIIPDVVS